MKNFLNKFYPVDLALPAIVFLPFVLLLVHPNWPLPGLNFDSLFSWGLYHIYDMKIQLTTLNSSHYYSRLGSILPGYAVFHIFPALWATYVLNFIYWYTSVFPIYFTVKMTINKNAAVLTSILMGIYPLLLSSFSAGFNDGPAVVYLALTILFSTLAGQRSAWRGWLIAAGMSFAGAVHSNFFLLNFAPVYLACYFYINYRTNKNSIVQSLFFMITGFALLTLLLGAVNRYFGGQFMFFWPSVKAIINYSQRSSANNPLYQPLYLTLVGSRHLVFPMLVFFGGIAFFLINRIKRSQLRSSFEYLFPFLFIFNLGIYFFWELRGNVSPMRYPEYTSFLFPMMFLALAPQLNFTEGMTRNSFRWFIGGVLVFFIGLRMIGYSYYPFVAKFKLNFPATTSYNYIGIIIPILTVLGFLMIFYFMRLKWYPVMLLFLIGVIYVFLPNTLGPRLSKEQFMAIDKGRSTAMSVQDYIKQPRQRFWIDESSSLTPVYKVVAGILGGYYDFFKWQNPEFEKIPDTFQLNSIDIGGGRPRSGEILVILTDSPDVMRHAEKSLSLIGLGAKMIKTETIEQGSISYQMSFIKIEDLKRG